MFKQKLYAILAIIRAPRNAHVSIIVERDINEFVKSLLHTATIASNGKFDINRTKYGTNPSSKKHKKGNK